MSGLGIVAAGLAGGAQSVGNISAGYIDQERRLESAKILSDMDEQKAQRLAEYSAKVGRKSAQDTRADDLAFSTDPANVEARNRAAEATGIAAGKTARAVKVADLSDPNLTRLEGEKTARDAAAKATAEADAMKAKGNDPAYIKALKAIEAAGRAPDTTDYKGRELDHAIKQIAVDNAKHIDKLKTEFATAAPDRKQQINEELSVLTGKDNDKFLPVPLKDELGQVTGYKVFDTKRGAWVDDAKPKAGAPAVGTEVEGYRFKGGDPKQKSNWEPISAAPAEKPKGIVTPKATPSTDPLAGLSREGARNKRAELANELQRWAGTPSAQARVDEIKTLIERLDSGQY